MNSTDTRFINVYIDKVNPKFELNGVLFDKKLGIVVATDTRAIIAFKHECTIEGIMPKKIFDLVAKTNVRTKPVEVDFFQVSGEMYGYSQNVLQMRAGEMILSSAEISGKFPDWQRIMPPTFREHYNTNVGGREKYISKENKTPIPRLVIKESDGMSLIYDVARLGSRIEDKYLKPIVEWLELIEKEERNTSLKLELLYREPDLPLRIEHDDWTITIMPIIY